MDNLIQLDTIEKYNNLFGLETFHPLVSVVDLNNATKFPTHFTVNYGIYALFLKQTKCGDIRYGRQIYDYSEGTITSFAPGQVVETDMPEGVKPSALGVLFHPDLIKGTSLGQEIKSYSFLVQFERGVAFVGRRERNLFRLPEEDANGTDTSHRQAQQTADSPKYPITVRLLYALLQPSVYHSRRSQQRYTYPV